MSPEVRFLTVLFFLASVFWVGMLAFGYLFGDGSLNLVRYFHGAVLAGLSLGVGYGLVLIGIQFLTFRESRITGFEKVNQDETGTEFSIELSLSKYIPQIELPASNRDVSPLESELIGFLDGLDDLPFSLESPTPTLRDYSLALWQVVRQFEGATPLHRAGVLAAHLGKVYAYKRVGAARQGRWRLTGAEQAHYKRRAHETGGMAAFILSQMPSFKTLHDDPQQNMALRRAILTGVRYIHDPTRMPTNCDPLAREIYTFYSRALAVVSQHSQTDTPVTSAHIAQLEQDILTYLSAALEELLEQQKQANPRTCVALDATKIAVVPEVLAQHLIPFFDPETQTRFQLWSDGSLQRLFNDHLHPLLVKKGWELNQVEQTPTDQGMIRLVWKDSALAPMIAFAVSDPIFHNLQAALKRQYGLDAGTVTPSFELGQHITFMQQEAQKLDTRLEALFPRTKA